MGPDPVAANIGDSAIEDFEIGGAFFEQNSAGGVVAFPPFRLPLPVISTSWIWTVWLELTRIVNPAIPVAFTCAISRVVTPSARIPLFGCKRETWFRTEAGPARQCDGVAVTVERKVVDLDVFSCRDHNQARRGIWKPL